MLLGTQTILFLLKTSQIVPTPGFRGFQFFSYLFKARHVLAFSWCKSRHILNRAADKGLDLSAAVQEREVLNAFYDSDV